ncbi:MAG TPA: SDR family oxidoreductase [Acidimicrobiales bacterium]|nr:SDR family oxidoreductase [Acidimicrobiales bacterium]
MDLGIDGRVALITASSSGLGRATAEALAAEGVKLSINGRSAQRLEEAAERLEDAGAEVMALSGDVTESEAPDRLVAATVERFGRLDIVVANAGGPPPGRALEVDDEAVRSAVEANLLTSVRLVRASLPHLRARGWGRICCLTSYSVVHPIPTLALSNLARSGLWAWARTAAADLAAERMGITLNLVCPGPHSTQRMIDLGGSGGAPMGDPADFGKVVAFLCSEPAAFVNGAAVVVDGAQSVGS